MGIKNRMVSPAPRADQNLEQIYREERGFRADRLVEKWAKVPEIGKGLLSLDEASARNTAILLENQTRALSRMSEAQVSNSFYGYTPENMLRLIRLNYKVA